MTVGDILDLVKAGGTPTRQEMESALLYMDLLIVDMVNRSYPELTGAEEAKKLAVSILDSVGRVVSSPLNLNASPETLH